MRKSEIIASRFGQFSGDLYPIGFKFAMFCSVNNSYNKSDTFPPSITRVCMKAKRKCHVDEYRVNGEGSENVTIKMNLSFFSNFLVFTLTRLKWQMLFHCPWS